MKYQRKTIISIRLTLILIMFPIIFLIGCENTLPTPITPFNLGPTSGRIIIEDNAEITEDCTPLLAIYSEEANYMSFSGDGVNWTDWIEYDNSYEEFNIANGMNGTDLSSGIKYVYVHFKDEEGNLSIPGKRNITAQYDNLKTGAIVIVVGDE